MIFKEFKVYLDEKEYLNEILDVYSNKVNKGELISADSTKMLISRPALNRRNKGKNDSNLAAVFKSTPKYPRMNTLRMCRLARLLSYDELAKALDVTKKDISELERGIKPPSEDILQKLADFFGCEKSYLMPVQHKESHENLS